MKRYVFPVVAVLVLLAACNKVEVPVYDSEHPSLNFVKNFFIPGSLSDPELDTVRVHAVFYPGLSEGECKLPVYLSGAVADYDRTYRVRLVDEKCYGNLVEGVHYTLPAEQTLHAGQYADSVVVKLHLDRLRADRAAGVLVVELVPDGNFVAGLDDYRNIGVEISGGDFLREPYFWGLNKLTDYGGTYLSVKAEKFAELNGITSAQWRSDSNAQLYAYGKRTYEWFRDNPTCDTDGGRVEFKGSINYE